MGRPKFRKVTNVSTAADLGDRDFARTEPDRLWMAGITEHSTREGRVYCMVVLDASNRLVVGGSIGSRRSGSVVTSALGMVVEGHTPIPGETVIRSDQGSQFTSWAFTQRAVDSGLLPSMGLVGDCCDNAMIKSYWSGMQVELLDCKQWRKRVEFANGDFEYLEICPTTLTATPTFTSRRSRIATPRWLDNTWPASSADARRAMPGEKA